MTAMENKIRGAWLLSQSKSIDAFQNAGRLENIQYAGRAGRLYNLLRRNVEGTTTATLEATDVTNICRANGIDRSVREAALSKLKQEGRIDASSSGAINVLGATATGVLETTAAIFDSCTPTNEEQAVLHLSERVAKRPAERGEIEEYVSDTFKITQLQTSSLIDVCKNIAILDQAEAGGRAILFNNNTFRDGLGVFADFVGVKRTMLPIASVHMSQQSKSAAKFPSMTTIDKSDDEQAIANSKSLSQVDLNSQKAAPAEQEQKPLL